MDWCTTSSNESVVLSFSFDVATGLVGIEPFCVVVSPVEGAPVPLVEIISLDVVVCGSVDVAGLGVVSLS